MDEKVAKIKQGERNRNFWYTAVFLFLFSLLAFIGKNLALAADAPAVVTYQGKLLVNGSTATTTQSIKFVLYDALTSGTALYTASGTIGTPTAVSTTVSNGFFTINLGDTGTNSLDPAVFKNNSSVYLEVIIGSETLSPRKRLTAAPYAFNAKYLDGISATATPQTFAYIPVADASGNLNFKNVTSTALVVTGESNLATTTLSTLNSTDVNGTNLNFINGRILFLTSSGTATLTDLTVLGSGVLATTTIASSTIGHLNVTNTTTIGGMLRITGNSYFGTVASGTWNGTAVSSVYGGTGQNSSGWTGFIKLTAGVWSTSTISTNDLSNSSTLAFLAGNQTFTGNNTFSATSTFATATFSGYLGIGTTTPEERLHIYNGNLRIDGPVNPTAVGSYNTSGNALNIKVSGKYAYVADGASGLEIFDMSFPLSPALVSTYDTFGIAYDVEIVGRYAYVADDTSGLLIIDIENPGIPRLVGSYDTSGNSVSVYVSGKYAYVADQTGGIRIIDVSNPYNPILVSTISATSADDIYIRGKYAYVADYGGGFKVVDISDPVNPFIVTSTGSGLANSVHVIGRYAYVSFNTSTNNIIAYNISNPTSTVQTDTFSTTNAAQGVFFSGNYLYAIDTTTFYIFNPGSFSIVGSYALNETKSLTIVGKYAYISNGSSGISILDIKGADITAANIGSVSTNNLTVWENVEIGNNISVRSGLNVGLGGILSNGPLSINFSSYTTTSLFSISASSSPVVDILGDGKVGIGTSTPQQKLHLYDGTLLVDTPANPTLVGSLIFDSTPAARSVYVAGKYAYVLTNNGLVSINVDNKANPTAISYLSISGTTGAFDRSLVVAGKYAYVVANSANTLNVVDISNPKLMSIVGTVTSDSVLTNPASMYVSGQYAYIASNGTSTVAVVDIANPASPRVVGSVRDTNKLSSVKGIYVRGKYAYAVSSDNNYLVVIDVSTPTAPTIVGSIADSTNMNGAYSVYVSGNYAYVASFFSKSLAVVDISDPTTPVVSAGLIDAVNLDDSKSVYVSGKYAYVASNNGDRISIVDISTTSTLRVVGSYSSSMTNGPLSVFISGKYAYVASVNSTNLAILDIKGADISSASIGNINSNDLTVWENVDVGNNLFVNSAINVGGGLNSNGPISINTNLTGGALFQISSSTNSSIFTILSNGNVSINTTSFGGTSYKLRIDAGDIANGAIGTNGFIRATSYITASTTLDLAETYPINGSCSDNGSCPTDGDVVCSDSTVLEGVKKCTLNDLHHIIGIISTNPGFLLGGGDFSNPTQNLGRVKVALAGRVPVKVSSLNGPIVAGDKLTLSDVDGVATKAVGEGPVVGIAMESYSGNTQGSIIVFVNLGWQNQLYKVLSLKTDIATLELGSSEVPYNLSLSGDLVMSNNLLNKLSFGGSALFETQTSAANAFIFNASNYSTSSNQYLLSLRSNNDPRFSVMSNGDTHTVGNIYAAGAIFGTSTNPGDLAERVDLASDDAVEPGDVLVVDIQNPDTYRRSSNANEQAVAGVVSTNPSIIVGNGKTSYTTVMAMVGRVPLKVSNENGEIKRGDLLVSASTVGYAMKYNSQVDTNEKVVGIIGVALEPFSGESGKIMALIRTGWISNNTSALSVVKSDLQKLADAQGMALGSKQNLSIQNVGGALAYSSGDLNLQGNKLLNVAAIFGRNNRWSIDEQGRFITRVSTSQGEKDMYAMQSANSEFVFSSSSQLIAGEVKIIFDQYVQEIIDQQQPIKINITLTSGEAKGIYVSEKNPQGFIVKELGDGNSSASFDWIVVARSKEIEQSPSADLINNLININSDNSIPGIDPATASADNSVLSPVEILDSLSQTGSSSPILTSESNNVEPTTTNPAPSVEISSPVIAPPAEVVSPVSVPAAEPDPATVVEQVPTPATP